MGPLSQASSFWEMGQKIPVSTHVRAQEHDDSGNLVIQEDQSTAGDSCDFGIGQQYFTVPASYQNGSESPQMGLR